MLLTLRIIMNKSMKHIRSYIVMCQVQNEIPYLQQIF